MSWHGSTGHWHLMFTAWSLVLYHLLSDKFCQTTHLIPLFILLRKCMSLCRSNLGFLLLLYSMKAVSTHSSSFLSIPWLLYYEYTQRGSLAGAAPDKPIKLPNNLKSRLSQLHSLFGLICRYAMFSNLFREWDRFKNICAVFVLWWYMLRVERCTSGKVRRCWNILINGLNGLTQSPES